MKALPLKLSYSDDVYPPSEDTHLLLEVIEVQAGQKVLEMGTGSGYIAIHCALKGAKVFACDISKKSIELAEKNAMANGAEIQFVHSDLFKKIEGKFDVIVFNPPYLPTEKEDIVEGELNYALDGGTDGNRVINRFLREAANYLEENGVIFMLFSSHNAMAMENAKKMYECVVLKTTRFFFEELFAVKLTKNKRGWEI
ncbi:MAG: HemK2/MTQ2 family protein methyltransferase [Thermoplasmata archaeon]